MAQSIGTRSESSLHRDLKLSYAGKAGRTEIEVAGFIADGINAEGEYIEVQIRNFGSIKKKIQELSQLGKVRVIYPVLVTKYIEVFNTKGKLQYRRKSPRRGSAWDIFDALVHAPELPLVSGLAIELVLVEASEQRVRDGKGSWRRKGVSIKDHALLAVYERIALQKPADYLRFVPFTLKEQFTSADLGEKAGIRVDMARKALYVLTKIGVVNRIGKKGNALVYKCKRRRSAK
ncbi:MAG: hypothetical protein LBG95_06025 [Treponema sp.]|jgi:stalled ribosome alternative rescue factor ArfA|nr:hypothetical protein [Treponema sp.]